MLILSETQVQGLLDVDELIAALECAHIQYSTGKAVMPVRLVVPLPQIDGRITSMPGFFTPDDVKAEIGEVLARTKPGRSKTDEVTLYKSVVIAIQDVAAAHLVYHKALAKNVGTNVTL